MSDHDPAASAPSQGAPDHDRSGPTIDDAVAKSEAGSQVEGVHTPSGQAESGESRVEQMPEVEGVTEGRVDGDPGARGTPLQPGPSPAEVGSGGAQRILGARISDRVSAGEPVPQGPPFDADSEGNPEDRSGAGG
ncbi:MAG: hypothetical protein ABJA87_12000 [bacterium]